MLKHLSTYHFYPGKRGYRITRLSIDLENLGHIEERLEVAEADVNDPTICHDNHVTLQKHVLSLPRLAQRWKNSISVDGCKGGKLKYPSV